MANNKLDLIRHDDFDFRLSPSEYIAIHEKFIEAGLVETAVLQFTHDGRLCNIPQELVDYMNRSTNWDFAVHGWDHVKYNEMQTDFVVRDISACMHYIRELFGKRATLWCTPWNTNGQSMEQAARILGLTISNESYDIWRFNREIVSNSYEGHSLYFHGWKADEMLQFPQMIENAKGVWHGS